MRGDTSRPVKAHDAEVTEVADGLVVYEDAAERVHYLNHTAAAVFELCTGSNTEDEIAALLGSAFGLPEPPISEVRAALEQMRSQGIVT